MKKNILRVIALVLVAGMLFSFCSCTQEVLIRFVDADGNDLDLSKIGGGSGSASSDVPPAADTTAPPAADTTAPTADTTAPTADTTAPAAPSGDTTAPVANTTAPAAAPTGKPGTTQEIVDFYKKAANDIKANGIAGYTKKEWQVVDEINIGAAPINSAVKGVLGNFMTTEDKAENQVSAKGSDDAKKRFPEFTLTDYSQVASATCEENGGNYVIKIVMKDEDTPKKQGSMLGQVTNSILYWEDIDDTLKNDSTVSKILTAYDGIHVIYKGFTIQATMTPDGKFISLDHTADVDILIGSAKILFATITDKSGHLNNYCKYTAFQY